MLNRSASLAMSTSVLKALPGKLDIKRHSPSILYFYIRNFGCWVACRRFCFRRLKVFLLFVNSLSVSEFCDHLDGEERAGFFVLIVFLMSCECYFL